MTRSTNMEHVEVLRRMRNEWPLATDEGPALDAAIAALSAPQAGEWRVIDDGWRLQSSNFGADAVLALSGDFATPGDRYAYAEAIAAKLNAPQPPAEAQPVGGGEAVAWVAVDTLNSPHPRCISSLAYMSQLDRDQGREYAPICLQSALDAAIAALSAPQSGDWVLVPREPTEGMLRAAHYELADKPFSNNAERSARAYAAMLDAAPQPPAEAQPVGCAHEAWEESAGWNCCVDCGHGWASASPPNAPVGVEGLVGNWKARAETKRAESKNKDWAEWLRENHAGAASAFTTCARELSAALAQQPAAAGEEIMVNAAHDVYTLPLQPSGLSSGPRFVVHVPGPEQQPAAVDEAMVFRLAAWMAKQDGYEDPHYLILAGSPPEPWGEVWMRYEDDAREALTAALAAQQGGAK